MQFLIGLHGWLLLLFPSSYREEYEEELQIVFGLLLEEARKLGGIEIASVVCRELIALPGAILFEHLRARRNKRMIGTFASRLDFAPGSRNETWAALAPFLLFGALPTLLGYFRVSDFVPRGLDVAFVILLWLVGLGLLVIGFVKRFPRWFMPYIGVPMPVFSLLLFNLLMEKGQGVWWYRLPWFLSDFLQQGLLWAGLVFQVVLLHAATRWVPKSRPFHQRLMKDWTLLSFIIYGSMPFVLVITYNEYQNEEPFMFLSLLILAAGGRLYLQSHEPLKRFLHLYGGMALSMLVAAAGKAILYWGPSWHLPRSVTWQVEFMDTLITWLWLAMIMLIPPMLNLLPRSEHPLQTS